MKLVAQFNTKYSNGKMTKDEFVEELSARGGSKEFWTNIYQIFERKSAAEASPAKGLKSSRNANMSDIKDFVMGVSFIGSGTTEDKLKCTTLTGNASYGMLIISVSLQSPFKCSMPMPITP